MNLIANLTEVLTGRLTSYDRERQLAELRALPGYRADMTTVPDRPPRRARRAS